MPWRFTLKVQDASGNPVKGSRLELSTGKGGSLDAQAPRTIDEMYAFGADDNVITVAITLMHARYATLVISLVRTSGERVWRWGDPRNHIVTAGDDVVINAVPLRVAYPPTQHIPEDQLTRWAQEAKAPVDKLAVERKRPLVAAVRVRNLSGVLVNKDGSYRNRHTPDAPAFHLMAPECLGDASARGWNRFKYNVVNVKPSQRARIHLVEYGEVGANGGRGPRFLVGIWVPNQLTRGWRASMDFLLWFAPQTKPPDYPVVQYPFTGSDYPYVLMSIDSQATPKDPKVPYSAGQRYVTLPFSHLGLAQHALGYQMLAANRAPVIVIPIAPSQGQSELWRAPQNLMRMLKEICRWIVRYDGDLPKVHLPPPVVGRVGVAGFSASGHELRGLLERPGPSGRYADPIWGTSKDGEDFWRSWRELWAIDTNMTNQEFDDFLEKGARWTLHYDRKFRVYKNQFTLDKFWNPSDAAAGEFGRAMRRAKHEFRGRFDTKMWAISSADPSGRIHAVSASQDYVVDPTAPEPLRLPDERSRPGAHENMPRLFFGHAAVTSGYASLV